MNKKILVSVATAFLISSGVLASDTTASSISSEPYLLNKDIYLYDFEYGGNGCPEGTLDAQMTSDFSRIRLRFDQYYAETSDENNRVRKSCNLGASVNVPQGLRVALVSLRYRGYVAVDPGAYSSLQAEYFAVGEPAGTTFKKEWFDPDRPISTNFVEDHVFPVATVVWSECGEDTILRANTSVKAFQSTDGGNAMINVDRLNAAEEVIFQLQWKSCD